MNMVSFTFTAARAGRTPTRPTASTAARARVRTIHRRTEERATLIEVLLPARAGTRRTDLLMGPSASYRRRPGRVKGPGPCRERSARCPSRRGDQACRTVASNHLDPWRTVGGIVPTSHSLRGEARSPTLGGTLVALPAKV